MTQSDPTPPVLILGAKSDIALAMAHQMAERGHAIHLSARNEADLQNDAADIRLRYGVDVKTCNIDVTETTKAHSILSSLTPPPRIVVSMVGWMGDQAVQERDPTQVEKVLRTNMIGPAAYLEAAATLFSETAEPTVIVGVSSVAGDRGRAKNYYYGAAKAGLSTMLSGLRQRLSGSNTTVITVKPGFVGTSATEGMDLPAALTETPAQCAKRIVRAIEKKREIVYPLKWRLIMWIIRAVPEPVFKRLDI